MPDLRTRLQESLGSSFTLERELVGGGMSRVFVAEETALGRKVVIKLLAPDLAAGVSAERFEREVHVAARLQHPHIVPVHTTGVAAELPFYTMPYVEGDTLRARLSGGPIPLDEGVRILRDVARALEYAHRSGVVHRDIKPENIFLAGSSAVVSDFGIAKAITVARTQGDSRRSSTGGLTHLTEAGTSIGTPAYMAPEQAAGAPDVDHKADIYSFGCVAYEVLSGAPPFASRNPHELIMAHIGQAPPPLSSTAPSVPPGLARLVMRCLAKQPDDRPGSATELVAALDSVTTPGTMDAPAMPRRRGMAIAAAVLATAAAVWFATTTFGSRDTTASADEGRQSLAVLPFVNVGGDTATEYVADGITDELATALGRTPGLRLAARSSAYRYKGRRDIDVREVGRQLNVTLVLTGTARRAADRIRVSAQLSSAADGVEIWSQTFDRPYNDVLVLSDSLTAEISGALATRLTGSPAPIPARLESGTNVPEAFDAYLQGKYSLNRRRAGLENAAEAFAEAIRHDPQYARAYAGLGSALALLAYFGDSQPPDRIPRSRQAAETALRLDSANAEAYVALGILALSQHQWGEAHRVLDRAIALEPGLADAHFHLGRTLLYEGRLAEGVQHVETARNLEPFSAVYTVWLGLTYHWIGRRDQALAEARRAWDLDSSSILVHNLGSMAFLQLGDLERARRIAREPIQVSFQRGTLGYVRARTGDIEDARRIRQTILDRGATAWFDQTNVALLSIGIGDTAMALDALERAAERGEPIAAYHPFAQPSYDAVRASPRFAALVRRLGLDPARITAPKGGRVE